AAGAGRSSRSSRETAGRGESDRSDAGRSSRESDGVTAAGGTAAGLPPADDIRGAAGGSTAGVGRSDSTRANEGTERTGGGPAGSGGRADTVRNAAALDGSRTRSASSSSGRAEPPWESGTKDQVARASSDSPAGHEMATTQPPERSRQASHFTS